MDAANTSPTCCFNMISRWFKKRKKSMDINSNYPSCKGDYLYASIGAGGKGSNAFHRMKSKSLVCNNLFDSEAPQVSEVRRASILVTEPKSKSTIQYYKKRVSFAEILDRKEFDPCTPYGLHEDEGVEEEEGEEEGEESRDHVPHDRESEDDVNCTKEKINYPSHHRTADAIAAEAMLLVS